MYVFVVVPGEEWCARRVLAPHAEAHDLAVAQAGDGRRGVEVFTVDGQDFGIYDLYAKNGWDAIDQFKEAVREQGILLQGHRFRIVDKKDTKL